MFTALFWKDLLERLVSTLAQVALGLLTADNLAGNIDVKAWVLTLVVAGATVVLKALVAAKAVNDSLSPASLVTSRPDDLP